MMAKRTGRKKSQLPEPYYEGSLEKLSMKDQASQKLWTCLCGNSLFFFSEKRDVDYVDKVDLTALISVEDDASPDCKADSTRFVVQLQSGDLKLNAPNTESRELWKGFIHATGQAKSRFVVYDELLHQQLSVPSFLHLLPGQIHMMEDVVQKEVERLANMPPPAATSQPDMPACFFEVPRLEAELLLDREANKGNLLLRPGRRNSFVISTKTEFAGAPCKHYRVLRNENGGFYIDVQEPVHGDTLQDVIDYLVARTEGLTPLIIEEHYDQNITFISSDHESGEKTQQTLSSAPAGQPHTHVVVKSTTPEAEAVGEEKSPLAEKPTSAPRKILMPPSPVPRKASVSSSPNNQGASKKLSLTEEQKKLHLPAISELKLKLERKRRVQD